MLISVRLILILTPTYVVPMAGGRVCSPQRVNDSSLGRFNFYRDLNALPVAPAQEQLPVGDTVRVDRFMISASFSASQLSIVFTTFPDFIRGA